MRLSSRKVGRCSFNVRENGALTTEGACVRWVFSSACSTPVEHALVSRIACTCISSYQIGPLNRFIIEVKAFVRVLRNRLLPALSNAPRVYLCNRCAVVGKHDGVSEG
jgi:hypothetical protein